MSVRTLVSFVVVAALVSFSIASTCSPHQFNGIKRRIKLEISRTNDRHRWPGRLLRIGFHDCFPRSCDGSIAHELNRGENKHIDITLNLLKRATKNTCCSIADAIKLGMEVSMELSGGPGLNCHRGSKTKDATGANPGGRMPARTDIWIIQKLKFKNRGFSSKDVVASTLGGHSLGRFFRGSKPFTFTNKEDKFNNDFVEYSKGVIIHRLKNGNLFSSKFNALFSDLAITNKFRWSTRKYVNRYAKDEGALRRDFADFMNRLCKK